MAMGMCNTVCFAVIVSVSLWAYAVASENIEMVSAVMAGGDWVLKLIAPLTAAIWAYFGILKVEHRDKLNAAGGHAPEAGIMQKLKGLMR